MTNECILCNKIMTIEQYLVLTKQQQVLLNLCNKHINELSKQVMINKYNLPIPIPIPNKKFNILPSFKKKDTVNIIREEKISEVNYKIDNQKHQINIYLIEIQQPKWKKFIYDHFPMLRFENSEDGLILRDISSNQWKTYKVRGFKYVEKIKDKAYMPASIFGKLDNKPFIMLKNKCAISLGLHEHSNLIEENFLNIDDDNISTKIVTDNKTVTFIKGYDLCYNAESYYTYLDYATQKNLQAKDTIDIGEWIKKHWLLILIGIIILGLLFLTPQGKELLMKLQPQNVAKGVAGK